jgi:cell wall-associated NlpC family hydrolase
MVESMSYPNRTHSTPANKIGRIVSHPLWIASLIGAMLLQGCGTSGPASQARAPDALPGEGRTGYFALNDDRHAQEVVIYALGLLGTGYQFGGRNPEAGLDCSGMVSYIVEQVSGKLLPHNAAQIAAMTRPVGVAELEPGDLVFFNTLNRRHSHMGIYIGRGQFIHAPSSRGSVRLERLDNSYFRPRIDGARRLVASR